MIDSIRGFLIGFLGSFVATGVLPTSVGLVADFLLWIGAAYYLVQCGTVQEAISKAADGIAIGVLSISLIVFGCGLETNTVLFDFVFFVCVFFAIIPGAIGYLAGQFVPESSPSR